MGPHINLTGGIFTTGTGSSASILSFVNRTNGRWYTPSFNITKCAAKATYVYALSTSFYLHDFVALLYCDSIFNSHIIPAGQCHIKNWYCNNLAHHLCTTWSTLAFDSKSICTPLQSDITVNSAPHKYFLNFQMSQITADASPTKPGIEFYNGGTVDIAMKEI